MGLVSLLGPVFCSSILKIFLYYYSYHITCFLIITILEGIYKLFSVLFLSLLNFLLSNTTLPYLQSLMGDNINSSHKSYFLIILILYCIHCIIQYELNTNLIYITNIQKFLWLRCQEYILFLHLRNSITIITLYCSISSQFIIMRTIR